MIATPPDTTAAPATRPTAPAKTASAPTTTALPATTTTTTTTTSTAPTKTTAALPVTTTTTTTIPATTSTAPATTTAALPATTTTTTTLPATTIAPTPTTSTIPGGSAAAPAVTPRLLPNDELTLHLIATLTGNLAPKSIVASGHGMYFAQNMMYVHTISVFDESKQLIKTIEDAVDLKGFGFDVAGEIYRGAPVEAAFNSDGSFAFVSNYRMYGPGYDPLAGSDSCRKDQGQDSFVYRIDTESLEIDHAYPVGSVPKFLAVSPDDRFLLVSNWCSFDVTVIDLTTEALVAEIEVGPYPRGIAISSDSRTAYVAVMGSTDIAVIGLYSSAGDNRAKTLGAPLFQSFLTGVGISPRHVVLSPDDRFLYVTLNGEHMVVAVDVATGSVVHRAQTGRRPRSMDISDDGTALYLVNYDSDTMSKVRTSDFAILQELPTAHRPIGITYDSLNNEVWVSAYSGVIHIYAEQQNP